MLCCVVLCCDQWVGAVTVLSLGDGTVLRQFGSEGRRVGQLWRPRGVRLLPGGTTMVVCDCDNDRLVVYGLDGAVVATFRGGFSFPCDVALCDGGAAFLVANCGKGNILKVSRADGTIHGSFGSFGSEVGEFDGPSAVALLPSGHLCVQEWATSRFQVFSS